MTLAAIRRACARTYNDALKNATLQAAAALSYYSILSIFPALILMSAVMAYIPWPDLFEDMLVAMGRVVPPGTMPMVNAVLTEIFGKNSGTALSLGTLGTLWVVSSAFDEMIEALNEAYDVHEERTFWQSRLLALGLAALTGISLMCMIAMLVIGPKACQWAAGKLALSAKLISLWPYIHWGIAVTFTISAVCMIYFLAPKLKQAFLATVPGAVFTVICWIGLSHLLGIYFKYFGNYNRIYGTLGAVMALMTWLYWVYFILLAGGELNAELAKERALARPAASAIPPKRRSTDLAA